MTWTTQALTAGQIAAFAANKPIILPRNVLAREFLTADPIWSTTGQTSDTDHSAAGFPALLVNDGFIDLPSRPATADLGTDTLYLVFQLAVTATSPYYFGTEPDNSAVGAPAGLFFDSLYLFDHNFETIRQLAVAAGQTFKLDLQYANLGTFASAQSWSGDFSVSSPGRWYYLSTTSASNDIVVLRPPFVRLKLHLSGGLNFSTLDGGSAIAPYLGEIFLGGRLQLGTKPFRPTPFAMRAFESEIGAFRPLTGSSTNYVYNSGLINFAPHWRAKTNVGDPTYGLNDYESLHAAYEYASYGTGPFVYIDSPSSSPGMAGYFLLDKPTFQMPVEDPNYASLNAQGWREQPPGMFTERPGTL